MAAIELATAYVTLAVDSSAIGKQIGKGFAGGDKIATRSGSAMGKSMRKAFAASKPLDVGSAAKTLEAAQDRLAQHTERSASKQKKAQEDVAAARQKVADVATQSSEKVATAQSKLESAETNLARVTEQSSRDQESAKRKVELAQAKYNDTVSKYGPESTQALSAANRLADAEDRLAKVTSNGAAKQEAAKRKVADAQEQYSKAVKESGEDSEAARKAADQLSTAEQQLEAASKEAASGHQRLSAEVDAAKVAFDKAERSSKGLSGAWSKAKDFGADYKGMGDRLNRAIGPKIWSGVKWGALGAAAAIGGTLAGSIVKGFGRLTSIENAEAKLKGLGNSAKDVTSIMDDALTAVKGTAFGMDEAASLAGTLVASGIKPGQELEKTLRLTADSATIAGKGLEDMGLIWGSVAAKGKLQGDDAMQLLASGVPIWQMVGDVMGKTAGEAQELGSKGQVSFEVFRKAMEKGVGGAALDAGNTTQGAFKNMNAAMSRFGAAILKDVFPLIAPLLGKVTDLFDYLTDAAGPAIDGVVAGFKEWANTPGVRSFLDGVKSVAVALYENALQPLGEWFAKHWKPIAAALGGLAAYFGGAMLVAAITAIGGAIAGLSIPFTAIGAAVAALVGALTYFFTQTKLGQQIIGAAFSAIQTAASAVADFFVTKVWPALLTGWDVLKTVVAAVWNGAIKPIFLAVASLAKQVFVGVLIPALQQFGGYIAETIWPIIQKLWTDYIQPYFQLIAAFGVWMWHTMLKPAFSALAFFFQNVLGPVVVWLWKNVISPAFTAIGAVIGFAFTGIIFPILDAFKALLVNVIAPAAVWLWKNVLVPAWNGIQVAISAVVGWITGTAWPALQTAWSAIGSAATWLWKNIMQPAWYGIRVAITIAVTAILVWLDLLKWVFMTVVAPIALWLWRKVMQPAWNGIKTAIAAVVNWFQNTAWPIFNMVITWLSIKFDQFRLGLARTWSFIKLKVIAPVVSWFQNTVWPIFSTVIEWLKAKFQNFKNILSQIWAFIRNNVIAPVVTWFRDVAWATLRNALDKIKAGFQSMRDRLKRLWNSIRYNVVAPVVNWFSDKVKPKIDTFTSNVKTAFNTLKDSVLEAWNKIKDGMKAPINGVINIYNDHIKGNFDKVANKLFGKNEGPRLPEMSPFHTGGYTGRGAKYTPAGVVHADEYVIRKESQNDLRRKAPGLLDSLNRHGSRALGYAAGGRVKLGMPFAGSYPRGDGFGARGGKHKGIDYPMPSGAVLKAVAAGVASRTRNASAGNKLELSIGNGLVAGYHHLSSFIAKSGQSVGRGSDVARVGSTGRSSGPHLHFSLKRDGTYVDPAPYLGGGGSAGSGGGGGWWNPFDDLWGKIKSKVSDAVGGGVMGGTLTKIASNTVSDVGGWVKDQLFGGLDSVVEFGSTIGSAAKASRWLPVATQALGMTGNMSEANLSSLMRRMGQESGYDPGAINNWDSNAKRGTPSKGLMQVIQPTFDAYKYPGYGDIWSPLDNILASIRYTKSRYGSLTRGWNRSGGYADGGLVKPFLHDSGGWHDPGQLSLNLTKRPEAVLTDQQWSTMSRLAEQNLSGSDEPRIYIENAGLSPRDVADEIHKSERKRASLRTRVTS